MTILQKIITTYGDRGFKDIIKLSGEGQLNAYSDRIYQAFCVQFEDATYIKNIEWVLRQYHAAKKVMLAGLFFVQAEELRSRKMQNLTFYTCYYSLFSALSSNLMLHPSLSSEKVRQISHSQVFTEIENYFVKFSLYSPEIRELLNDLRLMRELYSYRLPLGGSLGVSGLGADELFIRLEACLIPILQMTNLLSFISFLAWEKKVGKAIDEYDRNSVLVQEMFFSYLEMEDHLKTRIVMDDDDYARQGYMVVKIGTPWPISWFIEEKLVDDFEIGWEGEDDFPGFDITSVSNFLSRSIG